MDTKRLYKIKSSTSSTVKFICSNESVTYDEFLAAGCQKLEIENVDIHLEDQDGTIIDGDVFSEYLKVIGHSSIIHFVSENVPVQEAEQSFNSSGVSLVGVEYVYEQSENCAIASTVPTASQPCYKGPSKEDLERFLRTQSSSERIFDEYYSKRILSDRNRKLLVNLVVSYLVSKYGSHPSKNQKVSAAKAVVNLFPNLKDSGTPEGYETFYDPISRNGWIEWRLKTYNKSEKVEKNEVKVQNKLNKKVKSDESVNHEDISDINLEELQKSKKWLENACLQTQKAEVFDKMKVTYPLRQHEIQRKTSVNILKDYPKFQDEPDLVHQDFTLMHPDVTDTFVNKWPDIETNVLQVFSRSVKGEEARLLGIPDEENNPGESVWDQTTRSVIGLIHLLPPTAQGKKTNRVAAGHAVGLLIVFCKTGIPLEDLTNQMDFPKQPCIVAVGPNKAAISVYYVYVDGHFLSAGKTVLMALDLLFKVHFVFNIRYEDNLLPFWKFIQYYLYNLREGVTLTPRLRDIMNKVFSSTC